MLSPLPATKRKKVKSLASVKFESICSRCGCNIYTKVCVFKVHIVCAQVHEGKCLCAFHFISSATGQVAKYAKYINMIHMNAYVC